MSWFSALDALGRVAAGAGTITVDDVALTPGHEPYWLNDHTLVYKGPGDLPMSCDLLTHETRQLSSHPATMVAAGGSQWLAKGGEMIWVAVSREGEMCWVVEHGGNNRDCSIYLDGEPVIQHTPTLHYAMVERGHVVWSRFEPREVWGCRPGGEPEKLGEGLFGLPVWTPGGMFVVLMTNSGFAVVPWGSKEGYVVATGEDNNLNPDALWINDRIVIVANTNRGALTRASVDITAARVPVERVPVPAPVPTPPEVPPVSDVTIAPEVQATIRAIFPLVKALHAGSDEERREGTRKIIEQVVFSHPGLGYGWKASSPTNPPSKDAMARQVGGRLYYMDLINGTSRDLVDLGGPMGDITGQHFIPVLGVNHLGIVVEPPGNPQEPPTPGPGLPTCPDCERLLKGLQEAFAGILAGMAGLDQRLQAAETAILDLQTTPAPRMVVQGTTGKSLGHSHPINLEVRTS